MWLSFFLKSKLSFQFSFFFHTNYVFLKHVFMSGNMDKIKRQEVITNREVLNPHINNTIQSNTNVCWRFPHGACLWQEWQLNKLEGKRVFLYESVDTNLLLHPSNQFLQGRFTSCPSSSRFHELVSSPCTFFSSVKFGGDFRIFECWDGSFLRSTERSYRL